MEVVVGVVDDLSCVDDDDDDDDDVDDDNDGIQPSFMAQSSSDILNGGGYKYSKVFCGDRIDL